MGEGHGQAQAALPWRHGGRADGRREMPGRAQALKGTVIDAAGGFGRANAKDMAKVFAGGH